MLALCNQLQNRPRIERVQFREIDRRAIHNQPTHSTHQARSRWTISAMTVPSMCSASRRPVAARASALFDKIRMDYRMTLIR